MIIFERIASPFEALLLFLSLARVWEVCLELIKYFVLMTGSGLVPERGDGGFLHIVQTCQEGGRETSVSLTWQGAGEQQILHVELVGFVEPKYFAGICQFDVLGEEGKGKKDFPK